MRKDLSKAYKRQLKKHKKVKQKEETELAKKKKIICEETWELIGCENHMQGRDINPDLGS